ncbi:MAG TPA: galactokinase [Pyrinomonadaceae bacterium]
MIVGNKGEAKAESPSRNARAFRAPGRVNLIGEHTDYNDGFVMPAAIGFSTTVTITPRADRIVSAFSESFCQGVEFDLDDRSPKPEHHWSDYVRGVAVTLELAGHHLNGATLNISSDVPIGSGLSSSAAIEVATALALLENSGIRLDRVELAGICQRTENDFVGMRCGIMDQFISCCGQEGKALLLDCRSLDYRLLPVPDEARLVICNTMVKHALATGEYNARRAECEKGVNHFAGVHPEVRALRDVTEVELEAAAGDLPELIYLRCRHVITENARTLEAASALELGDLERFGQLMNQSHRSLRDDYEVSCAELDLMVQLAQSVSGGFGARMTGGGFGGCTINLVKAENVDEFKRVVAQGYEAATGLAPEIYVCSAAAGAGEIIADCQVASAD